MISAAAAETHTFARVKRNGYDPHEVDAVVARLINDLHRAEAQIDDLAHGRIEVPEATVIGATPQDPPEIRHLVDALS
jgi:DivIVA domain-containing protein